MHQATDIFLKMFLDHFNVNPTLFDIFCTCTTVWLIKHLFNFINRLQKLPPGPWGLPIVGYLPFIKKDAYIQMTELGKKYGPVFSFKGGQFDVVVINDGKAIEEAFKNDHLLARPNTTFIPGQDHSIFEMSGETWRQQRRVALTILRNIGLGKSTLEEKIKEEIGLFIDSLKSAQGKLVDFSEVNGLSVANNISILMFGHRFEYNDPFGIELRHNMKQVSDNVDYFTKFIFTTSLSFLIPLAAHFSSDHEKVTSNQKDLEDKVTIEVAKHREKQTTHEIENYIDGFLQEMDKQKDSNTSFNINTLRRNAADFYAAGSDTTTHVLNFMMLYLVTYPEHQQKIRDEIKQTIGFDRQPDYADRASMPFTMAFIYESLRMSTLVPLNVLRRATQDTKVMNYSIPKDTLVILNFWAVHRDPKLWNDPHSFKPERFLSEDETTVVKSPYLMPFSGGKRICPGATLALIELFLYLVSIVQNFQVSVPKRTKISDESKYLFLRTVKNPVKLNFHTLNEN
ncbi:cytochrome P450 2J6-like [Tetranychus urticae]|uniref:Cytochrome P450 n=1 Tax=Tetranychus urticae TaxID=32264 RepID=T1PS04_TETUR|nr:cytochrome P450 2J6-like [Tetranychus urticae]AFQ61040.1 cytochrome P450 [Tetranychus urticae]